MTALKPQDVLVLLKLAVMNGGDRTYPGLAAALGLSPSEVHASVRRAQRLGLIDADRRPIRAALLELLIHGVKYVFAVEIEAGDDPPPVWPDPEGTVRGEELKPLYRSAVKAARNDSKLYQCLALVDAIRGGRARERQLAEKHLRRLLGP
jgi:DNA-binding Lrp family transcriptional regulator